MSLTSPKHSKAKRPVPKRGRTAHLRAATESSSTVALRKSGGALIVTVPKPYIHANGLSEGAHLKMQIKGATLTLEPAAPKRRRPTLAELLANTPDMPMVPGWDEAPAIGLEATP